MPVDTYINLRAFVDELVRCGMRNAVTSPGSRNTPLVLALARDGRLRVDSVIDERCAGFFALGAAKASGLPVAVTCTSGTAAANLLPAVIEAREARVPLVVITADRPPELRELGAGQTIDQVKLYGTAAKWYLELDEHPATPERVRWMRQLACRAYATALQGPAGVVHLNVALREPLVVDDWAATEPPPGRANGEPWTTIVRGKPELFRETSEFRAERPVVVAGRGADGAAVAAACAQARVPLLADPLSGARRGGAAVAHYDALLRGWSPEPDLAIRVGDLPTSKPLRQWLARLDCPQLATDPWQDPDQAVTHALPGFPSLDPAEPAWLAEWTERDHAASAVISDLLADEMTEPNVARHLIATLPADHTLFVASSMPIRDVETFAPARDDAPRVLANRGANGIDGTISTAAGVAATGARTTLLIGDVALLHDIGGLHNASELERIVVLDNDGGGIFDFLPVSTQDPEYTRHVATPHGLDLEHAARLYGLPFTRAAELADLQARGMIVVASDRQENVALHRRIWHALQDA